MNTANVKPFGFFGIVFLFSTPFWVFGFLVNDEFLPGLPVSSVMVICPVAAATLLTWRSDGAEATRQLLLRAIDFGHLRPWVWLVSIGTMPMVMLLSGLIMLSLGMDVPPPRIEIGQTIALVAVFFVAATAEELGWTAYLSRSLVKQRGIFGAGLIIGIVSAVWHIIPLLQADRDLAWIAWWTIGAIGRRVLIVWLYVRSGYRVVSASVFHTMSNVSWMLFPVMGSHYDPVTTGLVLLMPTLLIAFESRIRS